MSSEVPAEILARLNRAIETGSLGDLGIDTWDRGGPPGQGYEAELLLEHAEGGTLKRTRFDRVYEPPFRVEEYTAPALPPEGVRTLAKQALRAFEGTFTEDLDPHIGGVTKISIKAYVVGGDAAAGSPEIMKTFFQKLPDSLAELRELVAARMAELTAKPPRILSKPLR